MRDMTDFYLVSSTMSSSIIARQSVKRDSEWLLKLINQEELVIIFANRVSPLNLLHQWIIRMIVCAGRKELAVHVGQGYYHTVIP